jgi:CSLREA domain-containing protein
MSTKPLKYLVVSSILFVLIGSIFASPRLTLAGTITVDTTADELDGSSGNRDCSLREAIMNANNDDAAQADCAPGTGDDIITLPSGYYTLEGAASEDGNRSGDLDISGSLTINGAGSKLTVIQAGTTSPVSGHCADCVDRVLHILDSAVVVLNNLSVRYGKAPNGTSSTGGEAGGGIYNDGDLTIHGSAIYHNRSGDGYDNPSGAGGTPGYGGGIFTYGPLTMTGTRVGDNLTGDGGDGGLDGNGWSGGRGGGICAPDRILISITDSIIMDNVTGDGGRGGDNGDGDAGNGAGGGRGGGIYCHLCTLSIINSDLISNDTGSGGNGGDVTSGDGDGGNGGSGGAGAGVYASAGDGAFTLTDTSVQYNHTGIGGTGGIKSGSGVDGSDAFPGPGGGLFLNTSEVTTISGSTIKGNVASSGGGISNNSNSTTTLYNSTVSGNEAGTAGGGFNSSGGATLDLTFVSVVENTAGEDGGGFWYYDPFTITNTIIADNTAAGSDNNDCKGNLVSMDYNLLGIEDSSACNFTAMGHDQMGTVSVPLSPALGGLLDNGGPTFTHAVTPGSPVHDQIPNGTNGCISGLMLDQRGTTRYGNCEIGAYEIGAVGVVYIPLIFK